RWNDSARNTLGGKIGSNKILTDDLEGKHTRFTPLKRKCKICRGKATQNGHYCICTRKVLRHRCL
ncbi:TPA: hypothetical protein N0F65_005162, partial [Lagenidium giganteum]